MLKYSVFIDQTSPCFGRDRKRVIVYELDADVFAYTDEHSTPEDMAKWVLAKIINRKIDSRAVINIDQVAKQQLEDEIVCEVDWKTELRIRASNALTYNSFDDIVDALWEENVRTNKKEIEELFNVFNKLDVTLMFNIIRVFKLPFALEEIKFKYQ